MNCCSVAAVADDDGRGIRDDILYYRVYRSRFTIKYYVFDVPIYIQDGEETKVQTGAGALKNK